MIIVVTVIPLLISVAYFTLAERKIMGFLGLLRFLADGWANVIYSILIRKIEVRC